MSCTGNRTAAASTSATRLPSAAPITIAGTNRTPTFGIRSSCTAGQIAVPHGGQLSAPSNHSRLWRGADNTVSDKDFCKSKYFAYRFVCLDSIGGETDKRCRNDDDCPGATTCYAHGPYAEWLRLNPRFAANEKCHNIIRKWNCATQVPPFDAEGRANVYALRSNSVWGSSACRSVCEQLWQDCGLYDRENASASSD